MAPLCAIPPCLISACLQPSGYPSCSASGNAESVHTCECMCAMRKGLSLVLLTFIIRKASAEGALARLDAKNLAASPPAKNVGSDRKHRNIALKV